MRDPETLVRSSVRLTSLPTIYLRLTEVANDEGAPSSEIARVISEDTALTARLLRLVNSAFFGYQRRIDTVSQAISIVGITQLLELALGSSVLRAFEGVPPDRVDMNGFWQHSIATAIGARTLAQRRRAPNAERQFIGGLLHDVGRLILLLEEPVGMGEAMERATAEDLLLVEAERMVFGFDHADVGRALLHAWKMPGALQVLVGAHHAPESAGEFAVEAATIHLADILAHALALGTSGEKLVPPLQPQAWAQLQLTEDDISGAMAAIDREHADVVQIMLVYEELAEPVGRGH
jgi:HD-like signal output (HDOD) protein